MSVEELEAFFTGIDLPDKIQLVTGVDILDVPQFIISHITYIKDNPELKSIGPFMDRLHQLQVILDCK
jgi:hypothetical protein